MNQAEQDVRDIFGLLYPMLSDEQQRSSEARKAFRIAKKYKQNANAVPIPEDAARAGELDAVGEGLKELNLDDLASRLDPDVA